MSLRNKRDSQARDNQNITDKENPKIPNLVSSKETKPLNYEHIIIQHKTRNGRLRFASSTILKNAKYDSLKGQRGTKSRRFSELITSFKNITNTVLECLLLNHWFILNSKQVFPRKTVARYRAYCKMLCFIVNSDNCFRNISTICSISLPLINPFSQLIS